MNSWRSKPIGDLMTFVPTGSHSRNDMTNNIDGQDDSIYNIHYGDIHVKYSTYIDFDNTAVPVLKPDISYRSQMLLRDGDLIMADASEDYEGVGASVEVKNIGKRKAIAGLHTYAMRNESNELAPGYAALLLRNALVHRRLTQAAVYSKVFGVTKSSLVKIEVDLPPKPEQERIVSVLEVWDEYLEKLDRKIALKEELKKGLMQQLLAGKKRLPGFSSEWQKYKLCDVCDRFRTGKLDANAMVKGGKYRFYTCAKNHFRIDNYAFDTEALLVSGNGANVGYIHYYNGRFNAYQRTYVLDCFKSDIIFIKYILDEYLKKRIFEEKCDGNTPYIKMDTLTDMRIVIPVREEQKAIANVLSVIDNELKLLKQKSEKLQAQKKYLLKNLITGKIRTPENLTLKKECINA